MQGTIKNIFPGGNTSRGFYSFYRYILGQDEARRIICIKGGPGTGKSSLMKKVGKYFNEKGYDIEYHHCSSDNNSLDGLVIKGLNVAILDGTSPHVVDPINPGAVDEVLNMGDCWNEEGFKKYRHKIIDINKKVGKTFKRAYRFFGAAKLVYDDWYTYNSEALNINKLNLLKENLKESLFTTSPSNVGNDRHLFATAFTPNGIVTYIENLCADYKKIYVLKGGPGTGKSNVLEFLSDEALKRGYYVEIFHTPLIPEKIEHILIPDLNVAILTSNEINNLDLAGTVIDMKDCLNLNTLEKNKSEMEYDATEFFTLLNKGLATIKEAKVLHDELETSFVPNMDFSKVDEVLTKVISKIDGYEKDYLNNR
ncbi:PRK06851 family protein [Clostridium estertheticum]|uniref:PRK06851 family protein n=1 Tax=Clostridium estertheticum TaxID=238834 RepID=UPI0013E8FFF6|nr:PRK06851 family protein [Clostridium estertheticum]MBZ9689096.1 PRK06851 family protein [Clostridium estertheticum]